MQEGAGPRPYDVSVSYLIELDPEGWLDWIGLPADGQVESIETDVGTVLAEVDKVLRVEGPTPWLAHIELQANRDPLLPSRLLQYHALLYHRHQMRVATTVVLLRPEADGPELTGRLELPAGADGPNVTFRYRVVRLWERPVTELLEGGLGVVPLAPLSAVEPAQPLEVVRMVDERVSRDLDETTSDEIWTATLLLLRLRYDAEQIEDLVRMMLRVRDTPAFQSLVAEMRAYLREQALQVALEDAYQKLHEDRFEHGRLEQARLIVLELGATKFGPAAATVIRTVGGIDDRSTLERLARGVLTASSWDELLSDRPES